MKYVLLLIFLGAAIFFFIKQDAIVGYFSMSKEKKAAESSQMTHLPRNSNRKTLLVYFSWGGNTRAIAKEIHEDIGGDALELQPEEPNHYPSTYDAAVKVGKKEVSEEIYPRILALPESLDAYDTIVLGYPIWWHAAPMLVQTFLRAYDFSGKTLLPFATSGWDPVEITIPSLQKAAPGAIIGEPLLANRQTTVRPWLKKHHLLQEKN